MVTGCIAHTRKTVPRIEHVSAWDFYPDPSATGVDDCEYVIQRHRMNKSAAS